MTTTLYHGDCLTEMSRIADGSVDAVICDPPYPHIKRDYGYWTTEEWWDLMMGVCVHVRRVLKPTGSAVFILQPNSEHVGQMRGWLWEFMAWVCREWNMVQDVWWWNITAMPSTHAIQGGLMRLSVKACVWAGSPDCYRNQMAILWDETQRNKQKRAYFRANPDKGHDLEYRPSSHHARERRIVEAAVKRGGVTPYNLLPIPNANSQSSAGSYGHGAGTPLKLADWWTRYIVPTGGVVCDPFAGSGTMGLAALNNDCSFIGIEKEGRFVEIMHARIAEAQRRLAQPQQLRLDKVANVDYNGI